VLAKELKTAEQLSDLTEIRSPESGVLEKAPVERRGLSSLITIFNNSLTAHAIVAIVIFLDHRRAIRRLAFFDHGSAVAIAVPITVMAFANKSRQHHRAGPNSDFLRQNRLARAASVAITKAYFIRKISSLC